MCAVFFSCSQDDQELEREKFIGTYSGTQTVTMYINNELIGSDYQAGTEIIDAGNFEDQVIIGKGSKNEVSATVFESSLSIVTQPIFVNMDDGTKAIFSTSGTGILSGKNLTINLDMKSTIDGDIYRYVVKEILVKN